MSEQQASTGMDLSSLLAATLDDVADLPSFDVPPPGYYKLGLTIAVKKINDKDAIEFNYDVREVMELADPTATPPVIGTKFSAAFQISNEIGLGKFKEAAEPVMAALGTTSFGDILGGQVAGMEVYAVLKHRIHKDDKALPTADKRIYAEVSKITPA